MTRLGLDGFLTAGLFATPALGRSLYQGGWRVPEDGSYFTLVQPPFQNEQLFVIEGVELVDNEYARFSIRVDEKQVTGAITLGTAADRVAAPGAEQRRFNMKRSPGARRGRRRSGLPQVARTDLPAREGRNPRTGERIAIGLSSGVSFKATKELKDALN